MSFAFALNCLNEQNLHNCSAQSEDNLSADCYKITQNHKLLKHREAHWLIYKDSGVGWGGGGGVQGWMDVGGSCSAGTI